MRRGTYEDEFTSKAAGAGQPAPGNGSMVEPLLLRVMDLRCGALRLRNTTKRREGVDRVAVPEFSVGRPTHHLEMQMRKILRRVSRRTNEAECVAASDGS